MWEAVLAAVPSVQRTGAPITSAGPAVAASEPAQPRSRAEALVQGGEALVQGGEAAVVVAGERHQVGVGDLAVADGAGQVVTLRQVNGDAHSVILPIAASR